LSYYCFISFHSYICNRIDFQYTILSTNKDDEKHLTATIMKSKKAKGAHDAARMNFRHMRLFSKNEMTH